MPTLKVYRDYTADKVSRSVRYCSKAGRSRACRFSMAFMELLPALPMTFFEPYGAE